MAQYAAAPAEWARLARAVSANDPTAHVWQATEWAAEAALALG